MKSSLLLFAVSVSALVYSATLQPGAGRANSSHHPIGVRFGRDIKPILSEHCFRCHGPDAAKSAAGLRLDSFAGATKTLADGAAIVPGNSGRSLLLRRVGPQSGEDRMPPPDSGVKPLSPEQIAQVREWIQEGARYEAHWSFVPPTLPAAPQVEDEAWCRNSIDRFVLAGLESHDLKPEPEADRDTLAMRAAEVLTGLPPSDSDLDRYRHDTKIGAYERFVDRLLDEPTYGEQQARYWLDAVRYGDTHGLQLDNERLVYPYRDWVVRAFNEDLPYTQFATWQLAGDLLPRPTTDQRVATGFVRMNLTSNEGGAIEEEFLARNSFDRVDTTGTVLLGMTVGCAKCHDHKYDPITQKDYYGLYAFFDSTKDQPLDGNISLPAPVIAAPTPWQRELLFGDNQKMSALEKSVQVSHMAQWAAEQSGWKFTAQSWKISPVYSEGNFDQAFEKAEAPETPGGSTPWKEFGFELGKEFPSLIGRDNSSVYVSGDLISDRSQAAPVRVSSDDGVRIWVNGALVHSHKITRGLAEPADNIQLPLKRGRNGILIKLVNGGGPDGLKLRPGSDAVDLVQKQLAPGAGGLTSEAQLAEAKRVFLEQGPPTPAAMSYRRLAAEKRMTEATIPMSLVAEEMEKPRPTYILKRGQYDQPGDRVERHVPRSLGAIPRDAPLNRLGFAKWLTSGQNPLFARVFVNRLWQQCFGTGIVKTSEDFGSQGEWPENQPLLDFLAVKFEREGWSVKRLSRLLVTSATFRQSARITPLKLGKDPENRLISRGPRFRLDAEQIRDKALFSSGLLVESSGGRGFKPYQPDGLWENASDPASSTHVYERDHGSAVYRRSLYLFWKRTSPPPLMVTFDSPLRDSCVVRRSRTNTPLQALATLNEPGYLEASRVLAQRLLDLQGSEAKRLSAAFERTLGREPRPAEVQLFSGALKRYRSLYRGRLADAHRLVAVGDAPSSKQPVQERAAWMLVCSSLMNTDEYLTLH